MVESSLVMTFLVFLSSDRNRSLLVSHVVVVVVATLVERSWSRKLSYNHHHVVVVVVVVVGDERYASGECE